MSSKVATRNRAKYGEIVSGDKVVVRQLEQKLLLAVIDGVGHGAEADKVSKILARYLLQLETLESPSAMIDAMDKISHPCIGASVGLAIVDENSHRVDFAGVGNIAAYVMGANSESFASRDGTVGCHSRIPLAQSKNLSAGDLIVMHSDGIQSRLLRQFDSDYLKASVEQILSYIFSNFEKNYDDASCIVYRF
ncbi:SpoIIE family protein phosphatase [Thalassotalea euphylliae]|uniref:SpoIIE family protein phosphatase n=1 Tax=Thalassotalea euphylliae TaxID=1655234 RepID=UPI0036312A5D